VDGASLLCRDLVTAIIATFDVSCMISVEDAVISLTASLWWMSVVLTVILF